MPTRPATLLSAAVDREIDVTRLEFAEDSILSSREDIQLWGDHIDRGDHTEMTTIW